MGPTAQEFHAQFGPGDSDRANATIDPDGVALAAIQGVNAKLERELAEKQRHIDQLEARLVKIESRLSDSSP